MPRYTVELKTTIVARDIDAAVAAFRERLVGYREINDVIDSITFTDDDHVTLDVDVDDLEHRLRYRMDGVDAGETYEAMMKLYAHIEPARWVSSMFLPDSSGWAAPLRVMNEDLEAIDPDYRLLQLKLKFNDLRVYVTSTKGEEITARLQAVASRYEEASRDWPEL